MKEQGAPRQPDKLLLPFLRATDEAESQRHLDRLVNERADPMVRKILGKKFRVSLRPLAQVPRFLPTRTAPAIPQEEEAEDVRGEAMALLVKGLRDLKTNPDSEPIRNFRACVTVLTHTAYDGYLRKKYPQRHRLKNQLRHLLTHQAGFALWESPHGEFLAGFAEWRDRGQAPDRTWQYQRLLSSPQKVLPPEDVQTTNLPRLVATLFDGAGSPIELDDLVSVVADLQGIDDRPVSPEADEAEGEESDSLIDLVPTSGLGPEARELMREALHRLWKEMVQLPHHQRVALLLNSAFEGIPAPELVVQTGAATVREIAAALAMPVEELEDLWDDLPLDDNAIAQRLGITRKQVIGLRRKARERLARRMKEWVGILFRHGNIQGPLSSY